MRVLVIDDSDLACMQVERVLAEHGHDVLSTASPIGVTRLMIEEAIEAVVLDLNLPSMRGDQLMRLFRSNAKLADVGVVLISGIPKQELLRIAEECEADEAVVKADIAGELPAAVARAYRRRRGATGSHQKV